MILTVTFSDLNDMLFINNLIYIYEMQGYIKEFKQFENGFMLIIEKNEYCEIIKSEMTKRSKGQIIFS